MVWLIALAIIAGLMFLPLGIRVCYDSGGAVAQLLIGPFSTMLYPAKSKKKASKQPGKPSAQGQKADQQTGGPAADFIPVTRLILKLVDDFRGKLRVNLLTLNVVLAGEDPCDLAQNYAKACAALGNLWPQLERILVIKKRDVKVQCDFEAEQTLVSARVILTITLGRILRLGLRHGMQIYKELLSISKKRKGGAKT